MKRLPCILAAFVILSSCKGGFFDPAYQEIINSSVGNQRNPEIMISQFLYSIKDKSDRDKVKAMNDWISAVVDYDYDSYYSGSLSYRNGSMPSQSYYLAITSGIAVCEGYANVLVELCNRAGIPCKKIIGYGGRFPPFSPEEKYEPNHAWNMVYVNGKWNLIDVTWNDCDDGTVDYTYFFIDPDRMIHDHFPDNSAYQLLNNPISWDEFMQLPSVYSGYFEEVVTMDPLPKKIFTVQNKFNIKIEINNGWVLYWYLQPINGFDINYSHKFDGQKATVTAAPGKYYLLVYAIETSTENYKNVALFGLVFE